MQFVTSKWDQVIIAFAVEKKISATDVILHNKLLLGSFCVILLLIQMLLKTVSKVA